VWCKTRTTAYDLSVGMNETIEEGATRLGISTEELLADAAIIRYSTTLAMNRLIERKGPRLGLLITEGFEDTTLIGRASHGPTVFRSSTSATSPVSTVPSR